MHVQQQYLATAIVVAVLGMCAATTHAELAAPAAGEGFEALARNIPIMLEKACHTFLGDRAALQELFEPVFAANATLILHGGPEPMVIENFLGAVAGGLYEPYAPLKFCIASSDPVMPTIDGSGGFAMRNVLVIRGPKCAAVMQRVVYGKHDRDGRIIEYQEAFNVDPMAALATALSTGDGGCAPYALGPVAAAEQALMAARGQAFFDALVSDGAEAAAGTFMVPAVAAVFGRPLLDTVSLHVRVMEVLRVGPRKCLFVVATSARVQEGPCAGAYQGQYIIGAELDADFRFAGAIHYMPQGSGIAAFEACMQGELVADLTAALAAQKKDEL